MIVVKNNPYLKELHELYREDNPKNEARIKELEQQSREYVQDKIGELSVRVSKVTNEVVDYPKEQISINKQYQELISLYRSADELVKGIRQLKKEMRAEIKSKREHNRKQAKPTQHPNQATIQEVV